MRDFLCSFYLKPKKKLNPKQCAIAGFPNLPALLFFFFFFSRARVSISSLWLFSLNDFLLVSLPLAFSPSLSERAALPAKCVLFIKPLALFSLLSLLLSLSLSFSFPLLSHEQRAHPFLNPKKLAAAERNPPSGLGLGAEEDKPGRGAAGEGAEEEAAAGGGSAAARPGAAPTGAISCCQRSRRQQQQQQDQLQQRRKAWQQQDVAALSCLRRSR